MHSDLRKCLADSFFEVINEEFKAYRRKYHVWPCFKICCREQGGSRLPFCCSLFMNDDLLQRHSKTNMKGCGKAQVASPRKLKLMTLCMHCHFAVPDVPKKCCVPFMWADVE